MVGHFVSFSNLRTQLEIRVCKSVVDCDRAEPAMVSPFARLQCASHGLQIFHPTHSHNFCARRGSISPSLGPSRKLIVELRSMPFALFPNDCRALFTLFSPNKCISLRRTSCSEGGIRESLLVRGPSLRTIYCRGSGRAVVQCSPLSAELGRRPFLRGIPNNCSGIAASSTAECSPISADVHEERFGQKGVRFKDAAGLSIVELKIENGSSARIVLQTGVVSSYKAAMWHGGVEEMLHTQVSASGIAQRPVISGGIVLSVSEFEKAEESLLSTDQCWNVEEVTSDPSQYVQVMLSKASQRAPADGETSGHFLQFHYIVTLSQASLSCAVVVSNKREVPISLQGALRTHVAVSFVNGAYAIGLQGYPYLSSPQDSTLDSLIQGKEASSTKAKRSFLNSWQHFWGPKESSEEAEDEEYVAMYGGIDRLYTMAPESFSLLDRGKRRSLNICSLGFEDIWLTNPGRDSGLANWDSFICVGPAQSARAVVLEPGQEWHAAQLLENPNN